MSTSSAGQARVRAPRPIPPSPPVRRLHLVPRRAGAPRGAAFVVVLAGLLVGGLVGLLLLNLSMQQGAFELERVQSSTADLRVAEQRAAYALERVQSTERLAEQAAALGMAPNTDPVFLDLSDGRVVGAPTPSAGDADLPGLPGTTGPGEGRR